MVAGGSLLLMSGWWFDRKGVATYVFRNVAMVAFALFCVWAGSVHGMSEMQRVAGTLMVAWLFCKPWDIPKSGILTYSFVGAVSCVGLFMLVQQVAANPERWSAFVLF